jgi:hypothetical protein
MLPRKELINDPNRFVRSRLIFSSFCLSTFAKKRNATAALYLSQTIGVESLFSKAGFLEFPADVRRLAFTPFWQRGGAERAADRTRPSRSAPGIPDCHR